MFKINKKPSALKLLQTFAKEFRKSKLSSNIDEPSMSESYQIWKLLRELLIESETELKQKEKSIGTHSSSKYGENYCTQENYQTSIHQRKKSIMKEKRDFHELIIEIEFNGEKIIPIRELAKLAGFHLFDYPIINFDRGTMNHKGAYYVSNIKREIETIDKFCAFVFSSDLLSFYYVNVEGKKEFVNKQIILCQKLREWEFIE